MNTINLSISALVFGGTLLLGTTAVAASRFVVTTIANKLTPPANSERLVPLDEPTTVAVFDDLRAVEDQDTTNDFDPSGSYSLDTEDVPKHFADIEFLEIETREYVERSGTYFNRPIVPRGMLKTTKSLAFTRISVGDREISFETESIHGISYQFIGQFPETSEMIDCFETCEYPADMKGKLKKMENGKVVAELSAEFYIHGC